MSDTGLPSSQVAPVWSQPDGRVSESEYPEPGARSRKVRVFDSVPSASSSRLKLLGERPPPAVNEKSCGSFGVASLTATMRPRCPFVKVQVTISPGATSMFDTELPSSQDASVWSHPL